MYKKGPTRTEIVNEIVTTKKQLILEIKYWEYACGYRQGHQLLINFQPGYVRQNGSHLESLSVQEYKEMYATKYDIIWQNIDIC